MTKEQLFRKEIEMYFDIKDDLITLAYDDFVRGGVTKNKLEKVYKKLLEYRETFVYDGSSLLRNEIVETPKINDNE